MDPAFRDGWQVVSRGASRNNAVEAPFVRHASAAAFFSYRAASP